ncbi:hypothetical protein XENTR_v10020252 [Xenopus tropicalis]|nr:hypothetical protein XENTR_v10020252 [Xenopus tropicalis]
MTSGGGNDKVALGVGRRGSCLAPLHRCTLGSCLFCLPLVPALFLVSLFVNMFFSKFTFGMLRRVPGSDWGVQGPPGLPPQGPCRCPSQPCPLPPPGAPLTPPQGPHLTSSLSAYKLNASGWNSQKGERRQRSDWATRARAHRDFSRCPGGPVQPCRVLF